MNKEQKTFLLCEILLKILLSEGKKKKKIFKSFQTQEQNFPCNSEDS